MSLFIVHSDAEMVDELQLLAIAASVPADPPFRLGSDLATARAQLAGATPPLGLVVQSQFPGSGDAGAGLDFALEMRARWDAEPPIPVLLIVPVEDRELRRRANQLPQCMIICEGGNFERDYRYALRCLVLAGQETATPRIEPEPRHNIHIRVQANGDCSYEVRSLHARLKPSSRPLRFGVDPRRLQDLMAKVPDQPQGGDWVDRYRSIGVELMQALIREQADVLEEFGELKGLRKAEPGARIGMCFSVDRAFFRLPFEALGWASREGDFRYWMQDSPLWRSLPEYADGRPTLFATDEHPGKPLNCLLVDAGCGGRIDVPDPNQDHAIRVPMDLPQLVHVEDEIRLIRNELQEAMPQGVGRIGVIRMIKGLVHTTFVTAGGPADPDPMPHARPFDQVLEQVLTQEGPWELVHFAGHSHFAGPEGREMGYVFVPRRNPLQKEMPLPQPVGITKMAAWLKGAGFVFLSGCSSSHREFVYHLCARDVPAMSGYPWPVLDRIAWQHAAHFYRRLLDTRSIEKALQLSWLDMYGEHGDAWAWASSRFVIQDAA